MVGRARADRVAAHLAGKPDGDGTRWWADLRGDFQRYGDGDDYDGVGPALTGRRRLDQRQPRVRRLRRLRPPATSTTASAAATSTQDDATLGGFAGWYGDNALGQRPGQLHAAAATTSSATCSSARPCAATPARRTAATSRRAASPGWDFEHGALHARPGGRRAVAADRGRRLRRKRSRRCRRRWPIPDQEFDSLIGSAGWQASYAINDAPQAVRQADLRPRVRGRAEQAFARSQSMPGTLPYAVPGPGIRRQLRHADLRRADAAVRARRQHRRQRHGRAEGRQPRHGVRHRRQAVLTAARSRSATSARWRRVANTPRAAHRLRATSGCSSMVELQLPKLLAWVRFPSPAPRSTYGALHPRGRRSCCERPMPVLFDAAAIAAGQ